MLCESQQILNIESGNVAGAVDCAAKPPAFAGSVTGFKNKCTSVSHVAVSPVVARITRASSRPGGLDVS